jgi:MarR family transcriptional regulator, transcriptional regulator for hemolysin
MIYEIPSRTLGFVINDVARLMRKRFERRARAASLGLTRAQAAVLANLARQEGINQVSLAQILELEPITLARLLDRLQAARLIERRPDPKDRRAHLLYLTEAAYPLLDRIFALAAEVREDALAGIVEPNRGLLLDMLIAMKANLTEEASEAEATGVPAADERDDGVRSATGHRRARSG